MFREVSSPSLWATWAISSVIVAVAGPFGTFAQQSFLWRFTYWSLLIALAIVISILLRMFWRGVLRNTKERTEDILVAMSLAALFGTFVVVVNQNISGAETKASFGYWRTVTIVFLVAVGTILARHTTQSMVDPVSARTKRDRLLDRLPGPVPPDARVFRISSDNHHIRVTINTGVEHRLLMRLKDAVLETSPEAGLFVHRSHWVAREAIEGIKKVDGRDVVVLGCGAYLPIGPKYAANLGFAKRLSE